MRLSEIFDCAREVMLKTELHSLPINPFYVCEKLNILVIPYSEMRTDGLFERIGLDLFSMTTHVRRRNASTSQSRTNLDTLFSGI